LLCHFTYTAFHAQWESFKSPFTPFHTLPNPRTDEEPATALMKSRLEARVEAHFTMSVHDIKELLPAITGTDFPGVWTSIDKEFANNLLRAMV